MPTEARNVTLRLKLLSVNFIITVIIGFLFSGTILRINIRKPAGLLKKRENFKGKRLSKLSFQQLYNI